MMQAICRHQTGGVSVCSVSVANTALLCDMRLSRTALLFEEQSGNSLEIKQCLPSNFLGPSSLQNSVRVPGPWREQEQAFMDAKSSEPVAVEK